MKQRLYSAQNAQFEAGVWTGQDTSGIEPIGDNVLILPDQAAGKIGKQGSIIVPEEVRDRHSLAAEDGIIVAMGDGAFLWSADRSRRFEGSKPKVGDRVKFERYAGQIMIGEDGRTYRCMTDKTIGAKYIGSSVNYDVYETVGEGPDTGEAQ